MTGGKRPGGGSPVGKRRGEDAGGGGEPPDTIYHTYTYRHILYAYTPTHYPPPPTHTHTLVGHWTSLNHNKKTKQKAVVTLDCCQSWKRGFGVLGEGFIDPSYHPFTPFIWNDFDKFRTCPRTTLYC